MFVDDDDVVLKMMFGFCGYGEGFCTDFVVDDLVLLLVMIMLLLLMMMIIFLFEVRVLWIW